MTRPNDGEPTEERGRYLAEVRKRIDDEVAGGYGYVHGPGIDDVADAYDEGFAAGQRYETHRPQPDTAKSEPRRVFDLDDLVRRVVTHPPTTGRQRPRWALVRDVFIIGGTSARELCKRFGMSPDEMLGGKGGDDEDE